MVEIPASSSTVEVSIVNTTTRLVCPAQYFVQPVIKGHEYLVMPTFSFIIKHQQTGRTILFDLGARKDWWNLAPAVVESLKGGTVGLQIEKDVAEVLKEGGVKLEEVDAVVWR